MMRPAAGLLPLLLLAGCLGHGRNLPAAEAAMKRLEEPPPTPSAFRYCSDHGCSVIHDLGLTPEEWRGVTRPLLEPALDAAAERAALASAVGRFEARVGLLTGTAVDRAGTQSPFPGRNQLDCVDEALNTTQFLTMLEAAGLLRFHRPGTPVHRSFAGQGYSHLTATLLEKSGGTWAIDSWFHDNGEAAEIVPLELWLEGWEPPA